MRRTALSLGVALTLALAGTALAQSPQNVTDAQSLCAKGYDAAVKEGRVSGSGMSEYGKQTVDANRDGTISKTEFDNACASGLQKRGEKNSGN